MPEESKEVDPQLDAEAVKEVKAQEVGKAETNDRVEDEAAEAATTDGVADAAATKKKKSKKAKLKEALRSKTSLGEGPDKIEPDVMKKLMEMNPALNNELAGLDDETKLERIKKMDAAELLTGLTLSGKNPTDMASYKFWQTQPVARFDDDSKAAEGPIKRIDPEQVPKEPSPMAEGYEWVTMELIDEKELTELYELLSGHYVEDDNAMFRFNYSIPFLNWALKPPGWRKEWHVGVRAIKSRKLVAFISGVPTELRVRKQKMAVTEINFLCIHKKLRSKRLAPVLIKEITRRCYLLGIYQAIYTAGVVLPKPIASCRYYHRALNWLKLYEVGFSPLPTGQTKSRMVARNQLPAQVSTPNLRPMELKDVPGVHSLLSRYLKRFDLAQELTPEEIEHWLVHTDQPNVNQVMWAYVIEDPTTLKITDLVSFYLLESSVIENAKYSNVRAAYLYYYASETVFGGSEKEIKARLRALINDALIFAKSAEFDVFNALTMHDNPLFLEHLKFGAGDGQLYFYLYNYRTAPVTGGVDDSNNPDEKKMGGVGVVML